MIGELLKSLETLSSEDLGRLYQSGIAGRNEAKIALGVPRKIRNHLSRSSVTPEPGLKEAS
jgi:hypothetical protein